MCISRELLLSPATPSAHGSDQVREMTAGIRGRVTPVTGVTGVVRRTPAEVTLRPDPAVDLL